MALTRQPVTCGAMECCYGKYFPMGPHLIQECPTPKLRTRCVEDDSVIGLVKVSLFWLG